MKEKLLTEPTQAELLEIEKMTNLQKDDMDAFLSSDALCDYLIDIGKIPLLTASEEKELFEQYALFHDESIKNRIMCSNLRLVVSVAKKYFKLGVEPLDLIQEGNIGLMKAIDKFDVHKGYRFSTYAIWWIRQSITKAIGYNSKMIRPSNLDAEKLQKINNASNYLFSVLERKPSIEEISKEIKLSEEEIKRVLSQKTLIVSFSEPINMDDDSALLVDSILDYDCNVEESVEKEMLPSFLFNFMQQKLRDHEFQVVALRWGLLDGKFHTLQYVSDYFNLSRERIRQIEVKAFHRLKYDPTLRNYFTGDDFPVIKGNGLGKKTNLLSKEEVYQNMVVSRERKNRQVEDAPKVKLLK